MVSDSSSSSGMGATTVLLIVLVILKALDLIAWPWWQVILLPFGIGLIGLLLAMMFLFVVLFLERRK